MSAVIHEPAAAGAGRVARAECGTCELSFDEFSDLAEVTYFAGVHNDMHHAGRDDAVLLLDLDGVAVSDVVDGDADDF